MKVTTEDYATLREAVGAIPQNATERERWDAFWRACDSGRLSYEVWAKPYYDDHIDTALRAIAKEG